MKRQRVTIQDIAKRLGISPAAVSTALTGRRNGIFVSEETKRKVWQVAQELGYPLERLKARAQKLKRIALFCPPRYELLSGVVLSLSRSLTEQKFTVLVYINQDREQAKEVAREVYRRQSADGIIFIGSRIFPQELANSEIPILVIGEVEEGIPVWRTVADNEGGGRLVGEYLWELGHRRVGMIFSDYNPLPSEKRLQGLRSVWLEHGEEFPDEWVLHIGAETDDEVRRKLPTFIWDNRRRLRFTALFCHNDKVAGLVLKCLHGMGIKVPDEISIVGFDNAPYAEFLEPPLTTVEQPFEQLGTIAAQLLQERFVSPDAEPKVVRLPCKLVVRASTAPPR